MTSSGVSCQGCSAPSEAIEWGFVLLARHGWTAELGDSGQEPRWRCPSCSAGTSESSNLDIDEPPSSHRRLRVLLVDDQAFVLRATALMLPEFDVVAVGSAAEALERLAFGSHVDVVVSDVSMPVVTGPELFLRVCQRHPRLATRFLFLSGDVYRALPLIAESAARAGAPFVPQLLEKPVPRDALVREIWQLYRNELQSSGTFAIQGSEAGQRSLAH